MPSKSRIFNRSSLWKLFSGLLVATALFFSPTIANTAHAQPSCVVNGNQVTCTYRPGPRSWIVPPGVTQASFDLYGGSGDMNQGLGDRVAATLAVTPGTTYVIAAGASHFFGSGEASTLNVRVQNSYVTLLRASGGAGGGTNYVDPSATNVQIVNGVHKDDGIVTLTYADNTPPNVTINQAPDQPDPAGSVPLRFIAAFNEPVTGFTAEDISFTGTAYRPGATTVAVSGGPSVYTVQVGGTLASGSLIANIGANVAVDIVGQGNQASTSTDNTISFIVDPSAPVITANVVGTLGNNGWYISFVELTWSVVDNQSPIVSQSGCEPRTLDVDTDGITVSCSATSFGGGSGLSKFFKIDTRAPVITFADRTPANSAGWNNSPVTVNWSCTDRWSGVVAPSASTTISTEGVDQWAPGRCFDYAGNIMSAVVTGINIDLTAPTITFVNRTPANSNGWNNNPVTVNWSCSDTRSGVVAPTVSQSVSSEGANQPAIGTCTDIAGNNANATQNNINIDSSAPEVAVTGVSAGESYIIGSVPAAVCVTTDALSGVASPATTTITGGNADGMGTFTVTCSPATDNADNSSAPLEISYTVTPPPDTTAPVITAQIDGLRGDNDWYIGDVAVNWYITDDESTVTSQTGCEASDVTSDTAGIIFTCTATSDGGTASETITIKRDATAPTIIAATTAEPNSNGWYNNDVTVTFTCDDSLSGVVSCPADQILSSEGRTVSATVQTVTDAAGNTSESSNIVTVQLDKTSPVSTVSGVSDGADYPLGNIPTAGCTTDDALSGVATAATISVTGGNADGTGSFTATCSGAMDNAGNSGSTTVTYSVHYNWSGFLSPVEDLPAVNTINAGQAVPVKFSLGGDFGLEIFAGGYPTVQVSSCGGDGSSNTNPIEGTVTAGNSTLQYDPNTQIYTYVWKTDKNWSGSCRRFILNLIDGSEHVALFQFNGRARSAAVEGDATGEKTVVVQQIFLPVVNR